MQEPFTWEEELAFEESICIEVLNINTYVGKLPE